MDLRKFISASVATVLTSLSRAAKHFTMTLSSNNRARLVGWNRTLIAHVLIRRQVPRTAGAALLLRCHPFLTLQAELPRSLHQLRRTAGLLLGTEMTELPNTVLHARRVATRASFEWQMNRGY